MGKYSLSESAFPLGAIAPRTNPVYLVLSSAEEGVVDNAMDRLPRAVRFAGAIATILLLIALGVPFSFPVAVVSHAARNTHQDFPPRPGSTPIVIGVATATPGLGGPGVVTSGQLQTAIQVALRSRYVKQLLGRRSYHVHGASAWKNRAGKLLGARVGLRFNHAATISGMWLSSARKAYRATYTRVIGLQVYVDVNHWQVVTVAPTRSS